MFHSVTAFALLGALTLSPYAALEFAHSTTTVELRKCRNSIQKTPLVFIDGRASTELAVKALDPKAVQYVTVACISPLDSTFLDVASAAPGLSAVVVWTSASPFEKLEPVLNAVRDAQAAHFANTGSYATDLATLRLPATPAEVKVTLNATSTGWTATAWVDRPFSPKCRIFEGGDVTDKIPGTKGPASCS